MVDRKFNAFLTDFGFYIGCDSPEVCSLAGSHLYLSPEALRFEDKSKTDVWAMGLVLYRLFYADCPKWFAPKFQGAWSTILRLLPDWQKELLFQPYHPIEKVIKEMLVVNPQQRISAEKALKMYEEILNPGREEKTP